VAAQEAPARVMPNSKENLGEQPDAYHEVIFSFPSAERIELYPECRRDEAEGPTAMACPTHSAEGQRWPAFRIQPVNEAASAPPLDARPVLTFGGGRQEDDGEPAPRTRRTPRNRGGYNYRWNLSLLQKYPGTFGAPSHGARPLRLVGFVSR